MGNKNLFAINMWAIKNVLRFKYTIHVLAITQNTFMSKPGF